MTEAAVEEQLTAGMVLAAESGTVLRETPEENAGRMRLVAMRIAWLVGTKDEPGPRDLHMRMCRALVSHGCIARAVGQDVVPFARAARKHHAIAYQYKLEERRLYQEYGGARG